MHRSLAFGQRYKLVKARAPAKLSADRRSLSSNKARREKQIAQHGQPLQSQQQVTNSSACNHRTNNMLAPPSSPLPGAAILHSTAYNRQPASGSLEAGDLGASSMAPIKPLKRRATTSAASPHTFRSLIARELLQSSEANRHDTRSRVSTQLPVRIYCSLSLSLSH